MMTTMKHYLYLVTVAALIGFAAVAEAQQPEKIWKIGVLVSSSPTLNRARDEALRQGLRDLGYLEGKNIALVFRYAEGKLDRLSPLARELVQERVDVVVAGGTRVALAAKQATDTIPIVVAGAGDLVRTGLVRSFAFPGTNVTGVSRSSPDFVGKRLEVLKKAIPKTTRVAALTNSGNPGSEATLKEVDLGARAMGVTVEPVAARSPNDFERAFQTAAKRSADGLFVMSDALFNSHILRIVELATNHKLAAIYPRSDYVEAGGLMSYAVNLAELSRQAAWYVDQIIKGMKPQNLALTEPTKFDLVISLNAAKQIGATLSPESLQRADKIIK